MNVNTFQTLAERTASPSQTREQQEDMSMLGMIGELGEYVELFKKKIFHGKDLTAERAREEAGDFLWYLALGATCRGAYLSEWTGVPDFADFDAAAKESLDRAAEANPGVDRVSLTRQPAFFFQLAKTVVGGIPVSQALIILAVTLDPFGGLAWAARDNIRKLEARHNLPAGDLDAVPAPAAIEATTTPDGNE